VISKSKMTNSEAIRETALKRFRIQGMPNVYTVGHHSGVVSFYSQQSRAFYLAYLLAGKHKLETRAQLQVGVLGGGVAGTTLWVALRQLGFCNCKILESTNALLSRQVDSDHRFAHPSINEWPLVGNKKRAYRSTTSWPFLNWFAGTAKSVVHQMRGDPLLCHHLEKAPDHVLCQSTVTEIRPLGDDDQPDQSIAVSVRSETNQVLYFDVVVCCLGYGYEDNLDWSASQSYWWNDHVRNYIRERHEYEKRSIFISGTGDGGLIDCVRLAAGDPADVNRNIATEVVAFGRRKEYQTLDNNWPKPPAGARLPNPEEYRLSDIEKSLEKFISSNDPKSIENSIWKAFRDLFKDPNFQNRFCRADLLERITLVSTDGNIFKRSSSVVNQVLVTFLKQKHPNLIMVGRLNSRQIKKAKGVVELDDVKNQRGDGHRAVCIVRHGAKPNIERVLPNSNIEDDKDTDSLIFEDSEELRELHSTMTKELRQQQNTRSHNLASQMLETYFTNTTVRMQRIQGSTAAQMVLELPTDSSNDHVYKHLGGFDDVMFGYPVEYSKTGPSVFEDVSFA
jgi:hypothetical protein